MDAEVKLVLDMTLLLVISGVCSLIFVKIKMPPILGYLAAGIILGPTMFPELWVEQNTVIILSNIGIVLLMFWIGLEQNMAKLRETGSKLMLVVSLEMTLVLVVGYLAGILMGLTSIQAIFLGAIISGTSTAVVVSVLQRNSAISGKQASMIIGITVFEDVGQVIILSMAAPLLAGDAPALGSMVNMVLGLALFFGITIALGLAFIPKILDRIGRKYPSEVLFVITVGLCFTMAFISSSLGLSVAIGAFLMGLIISRSIHSPNIMARVVPVKELFMAVFFISIGMLVDLNMIWGSLWLVAAVAGVFMIAKAIAVGISVYIFGHRAKDSFLIATSLLAMGEFAFIIAKIAFDEGVLAQDLYSIIIAAALVTMTVMPILAKFQEPIYRALVRLAPHRLRGALSRLDEIKFASLSGLSVRSGEGRILRREIAYIFMDYLIIVSVLLLFRFLARISTVMGFLEVTELPEVLLFTIPLLAILLASINISGHVRRVSHTLTGQVMKSKNLGEGARKYIYHIFTGIWTVAMFVVIILLVLPFVPGFMLVHPVALFAVVLSIASVAVLGWSHLRRGYANLHHIMAGRQNPDEKPKP